MIASIKLYLKILATLGFLAALAGVLLVAAWVNIPQRIEIRMKGACPSIEKGDFRYIDFLDLELGVPSSIFTECFAYAVHDGLGIDPATIGLDAELPNFTPLKGIDQRSVYQSDDQIRIVVRGYDLSDSAPEDRTIDPNEVKKSLENMLARKNRQGELIYKKSDTQGQILEKYTSNKTIPIYSGDIYVDKNSKGKVNFYLDCFEDKVKHNRHWNCKSSSKSIYPGITYKYYYDSKYISDARNIDRHVSEMFKVSDGKVE